MGPQHTLFNKIEFVVISTEEGSKKIRIRLERKLAAIYEIVLVDKRL